MVSLGPGVFGGAAAGGPLVGAAEGDDAAVLRLDDERALVLTTDFFTPIVDDARDWGRIAAANALSDVYAMGGRPVMALNLTAWPGETLPLSLLADVLRGGAAGAASARCPGGGGRVDDHVERGRVGGGAGVRGSGGDRRDRVLAARAPAPDAAGERL